MSFELRIPSLGESVTEGTIVRWIRQDGERVGADDMVLELETDKASMELPAGQAGVLRIVKPQGETVSVGDLVARIEDGASRAAAAPTAQAPAPQAAPPQPAPAPRTIEPPAPAARPSDASPI